MYGLGIFIFFLLIIGPQSVFGDLECVIRNDLKSSDLGIRSTALNGLKIDGGRNKTHPQVFQCHCGSDTESLTDSSVNEFDDKFNQDYHEWSRMAVAAHFPMLWQKSEILRIFNCSQLSVSLRKNQDGIADKMNGKILLFENIAELKLNEFLVGVPTNNENIGTFSSIYFRNVVFRTTPSRIEFGDKYDVLMSNITLHPSFSTTFKIQVENRDPNIMPSSIFGQNGPVFQLENSEFDGINELSQTQTKIVSISLKNVQKEIDVNINVEQCNYDYKGTFNIIGNKFGFLGTQDMQIVGANRVNFENNTIDVIHKDGLDLSNIKSLIVKGNSFGIQTKKPAIIIEYDMKVNPNCNDGYDLPISKIQNKTSKFSSNMFGELTEETIEIYDKDDDYPTTFVNAIFEITGNSIMKPCNCRSMNEDFVVNGNIDIDSDRFYKMIMKSLQCFTNHVPPILGSKKEICSGKIPKNGKEWKQFLDEKYQKEKTSLASSWGGGLAAGIILTLLITVGVTIILAKFFCKSYMNSPDIFPCEKCKRGVNSDSIRETMVSPKSMA